MNKKLYFVLIITLFFEVGCQKITDWSVDGNTGVLSQELTLDSTYTAYYQKYIELVNKYGEPEVVLDTITEYKKYSYLEGVCVAELFDFNDDGTQDLFVVYSNKQYTGKQQSDIESDKYDISIPQASSYEIEIWTFKNGNLIQLLHQLNVGSYLSFDNEFWDTDNCMITIYEKSDGLPVIQLYDPSKKWIGYTNLYWVDDKFIKDELIYRKGSFTLNGESISEEIWSKQVAGYNTILYLAHLSNPDETAVYSDVLVQTKDTLRALSQGESVQKTPVQTEYISLYLIEIDRANREHSNPNYFDFPVSYSLYDIDRNGIPELFIKSGNCEANFMYNVFTVLSGKTVHCGEFSGFHTSLYTDLTTGIVRYEGHMMVYTIQFITLEGTKLKIDEIASGSVKKKKWDEGYPKLDSFGYEDYDCILLDCYVTTPLELYKFCISCS